MRELGTKLQWLNPQKRPGVWVLVVGFLCALVWAKAQDPFVRKRFSVLRGTAGGAKAVAVLSKPVTQRPVAIFLHDAGADLEGSGLRLRQLAELGVAAVGLEYNQTNQAIFNRQFAALLARVGKEDWADTNAVAWLGYGAGAQRLLRFARSHGQLRPHLLVCLAGGQAADFLRPVRSAGIPAGTPLVAKAGRNAGAPDGRVALVHGQADESFPVKECERLAEALRAQGVPAEVCILEGQGHNFGENRDVVFRLLAEHIAAHFGQSLRRSTASGGSHWVYWTPLLAVVAIVAWGWGRKVWRSVAAHAPRSWPAKGFTALAVCVALVALGDAALRMILPRCAISGPVLTAARWLMLAPDWRANFELLAADSGWTGRPFKHLLQHAELAALQQTHFYTNLDAGTYHQFVLSPRLGESGGGEWGWRRTLWEAFYPRVRRETGPVGAARTVVRFLRERVAICPEGSAAEGVETAWREGAASDAGFDRLYVAALRSVGIAARVGAQEKAELWTGSEWAAAPEPFARRGLVFTQ